MSSEIRVDTKEMTAEIGGVSYVMEDYEFRASSAARYSRVVSQPPRRGIREHTYRLVVCQHAHDPNPALISEFAAEIRWTLSIDGHEGTRVLAVEVAPTFGRNVTIVAISFRGLIE